MIATRLQARLDEIRNARLRIQKPCLRCGKMIEGNRFGSYVLNAMAHSAVCFGHVPEPSQGEPVFMDDPWNE